MKKFLKSNKFQNCRVFNFSMSNLFHKQNKILNQRAETFRLTEDKLFNEIRIYTIWNDFVKYTELNTSSFDNLDSDIIKKICPNTHEDVTINPYDELNNEPDNYEEKCLLLLVPEEFNLDLSTKAHKITIFNPQSTKLKTMKFSIFSHFESEKKTFELTIPKLETKKFIMNSNNCILKSNSLETKELKINSKVSIFDFKKLLSQQSEINFLDGILKVGSLYSKNFSLKSSSDVSIKYCKSDYFNLNVNKKDSYLEINCLETIISTINFSGRDLNIYVKKYEKFSLQVDLDNLVSFKVFIDKDYQSNEVKILDGSKNEFQDGFTINYLYKNKESVKKLELLKVLYTDYFENLKERFKTSKV